MTNTKSTKRALWASVLSIVVCFAMLIGSTFAWFTDSATTGVNTIQSGNLDMKVSYKNATQKTWAEVTENDKLFNDAALWEPGYTEVAYLKIENNGNLAFKYRLNVNVINEVIGKSVLGNDIKLSEVLKYDLVELNDETTYATRDAAMKAVEAAKNLTTETVSGSINANTTANYFALIVYMPESVGNEANHNGANKPSIQLGVTVYATQYTVEKDSFNDQYDADAYLPTVVSDATMLNSALNNEDIKEVVVTGGIYNQVITVPEGKDLTVDNADVDTAEGYNIAISAGKNTDISLNGGTFTAFEYAQVIDAQAENSKVLVNGGNYEGNYMFCVDKNANIVVNNCVFCTESYPGTVIVMTTSDYNTAAVTINGGTFYSEAICDNSVDIVITGGTFYLTDGISNYQNSVAKDKITITGGKFNIDPSECVPSTHQAIQGADGFWTVTAK